MSSSSRRSARAFRSASASRRLSALSTVRSYSGPKRPCNERVFFVASARHTTIATSTTAATTMIAHAQPGIWVLPFRLLGQPPACPKVERPNGRSSYLFFGLSGGPAQIHQERRARNRPAVRAEEERSRTRDLLGLEQALHCLRGEQVVE